MNSTKLKKDKRNFLLIGLPISIFLIIFLSTNYFQISAFFILILIISILGLYRKNKSWIRSTKIVVFTFLIYLVMFNNVFQTPTQIIRRLPGGRNHLLEPNHEKVIEFKQDFYKWHEEKYNLSFNDLSEDSQEELETKLLRVDYYIREIRFEYTFDTSAPYYYYDHLPTIDEIFKSDTDDDGKLQDDCDGITILTVSLLLNMGYNAWVAECEFHYHAIIFPEGANPKTLDGIEKGIELYNSKKKPTYLLFNEKETIIPPNRPIVISMFDVFTGKSMYEVYFVRFIEGTYFNVPFYIMIVPIYLILLLLSIGINLFVKLGEISKDLKRNNKKFNLLKISLKNSIFLCLGIFMIYWLATSGLASYCNLILSITLIFAFRYSEYQLLLKKQVKFKDTKM